MRFEGRVALVTGGGRGIGAATSRLFHRDGASVVVCDLDEEPAREVSTDFGDRGDAVACDVARRDHVEAAIQAAADHFGRLDLLVCCAGITRDNLVHKMSDDDWDSVIETHLRGSFLCCQAAQRLMVQQRYGKIVLLSSTSALGNRGQANYSAAKAGMQGFTKTLAIELGKFGVTANAIAPGFIETEMTAATAERLGVGFDDFKQAAAAQIPVNRVGQPEDIANTVSFLVSEGAGFVSGQVIYVAGGPKD